MPSFASKQQTTIAYLESPAFAAREDAQSSLVSIPLFILMIRNGFITEGSQEGLIKSGYNETTEYFYEIQERAYVTGIMKKPHAKIFVENINVNTDKVAFISRVDPTKYFDDLFQKESQPSVATSKEKSAKTQEILASKKFFSTGHLQLVFPLLSSELDKKEFDEEVEIVQVFDPVYGRNASYLGGLYRDILNNIKA